MGLVYAVILTCLSGKASLECHPTVLSEPMPLVACVTGIMPNAAVWMGEHPDQELAAAMCVDQKKLDILLKRHEA